MAPRKPRAPKAAALPPTLPAGLVMSDLTRRAWRLGVSIGSGGFGQIYSASLESGAPSGSSAGAQYVIKVEAHASGPLFSEMHCYHRVARAETIAAWQKARGLKRFGMPRFVGSGSFDHGGEKFRFMVIERFGTDLQKLLEQNNNRFPMPTILHIGIQVLEVLEFIHSQEYIHGDIKGQNLLLGLSKDTKDLVYLVDFGLACRYASDGVHKEYKLDLRKAHNGTIEFTSRDAHIGAQSRRGDIEILGYNLLQWASGTLPWMNRLQSAEKVAEEKNRQMGNVPGLIKACFQSGLPKGADAIQRFLSAVAALKFAEKPDYVALKAILQAGLKSLGNPPVRLVFTADTDVSSSRSPLQPVQESAVPRRRPAAAAAKRPGRGRAARAATSDHSAEDSDDDVVEVVPRRRPAAAAKRPGRGRTARAAASDHSPANSDDEVVEAVPRRRPAAAAAAKRPGRGRAARAAASDHSAEDSDDEVVEANDEPRPLVIGGRGGGRGGRKRTSEESWADEDGTGPAPGCSTDGDKRQKVNSKASSDKSSTATNSASNSSIYDNINPAMQDVLDRRVKAEKASKAKVTTAKLKPKPASVAASRARGMGRTAAAAASAASAARAAGRKATSPAAGRRVASPRSRAVRPVDSEDDGDGEESFHTPSGTVGLRRSGRLSGGAAISPLAQPRRAIRSDWSPELY